MRDHEPAIRAFFDAYARRMNDALADPPRTEVKEAREAFAGYFVGADPHSVRGGKNGLLFRLMIPLGYRRYRRLGCKRMELERIEVTGLDDFHVLTRTHWNALFRRKEGSVVEIPFDNIYLLHIAEGEPPRIFAWITGDERRALKDAGIS